MSSNFCETLTASAAMVATIINIRCRLDISCASPDQRTKLSPANGKLRTYTDKVVHCQQLVHTASSSKNQNCNFFSDIKLEQMLNRVLAQLVS